MPVSASVAGPNLSIVQAFLIAGRVDPLPGGLGLSTADMSRKGYTMARFVFVIAPLIFAMIACNGTPTPDMSCSTRGSSTLFVAMFDDDVVGSLPVPAAPGVYGPPGASLDIVDGSNTVEVVDSAALGSKALSITRGSRATEIYGVVGDIGEGAYDSGVYYVEFRAHGAVIPEQLIAGVAISVQSTTEQDALLLKLYADSYHYREADSYLAFGGSYDPSGAHNVHITLNLDSRTYSICVDDSTAVSDKALFSPDFGTLHSLKFFAPATITEAFDMIYVVDEIRITK